MEGSYRERMDYLAERGIPFFFIIDYSRENSVVLTEDELARDNILYSIGMQRNYDSDLPGRQGIISGLSPLSFEEYREKFEKVRKEISWGNTYLLNLTHKTEIQLTVPLKEVFLMSRAPYKLFFRDRFVLFSPESFIKIRGNEISTYPMKGTRIRENDHSAEELLSDSKESAEHATITDLLRNDLGKVALNIRVERYRYLDEINTGNKIILQLSSEIKGKLLPGFQNRPGSVFHEILPAGSVTGAPKKETLRIIRETENYDRGFYTGVFGYFDGEGLDSAVMIRFIENENGKYYYKSGGGITFMSEVEKEYKELIDKIYVPVY